MIALTYPKWMLEGLCSQTDPELFFPEKSKHGNQAKLICIGCPVREKCLSYALKNDERHGVWGGKSERERSKLSR
jgi:WhiB family redox-sensing transcriptional regulator